MQDQEQSPEPFSLEDYTNTIGSTTLTSEAQIEARLRRVQGALRSNQLKRHLPSLRRTLAALVYELEVKTSEAVEMCSSFDLQPGRKEIEMIKNWRRFAQINFEQILEITLFSLPQLTKTFWEGQAIVESVCDLGGIRQIGVVSSKLGTGVLLVEDKQSNCTRPFSFCVRGQSANSQIAADYFSQKDIKLPQLEDFKDPDAMDSLSREVKQRLWPQNGVILYMKPGLELPFEQVTGFVAEEMLIRYFLDGSVNQRSLL